MFHSPLRTIVSTIGALGLMTQAPFAETSQANLTLKQLTEGTATELVQNQAFMPTKAQAAPIEPFNGKLLLSATEMQMAPALETRQVMDRDAQLFPGVTFEFFSHEGDLVPVTQDIITPPGQTETDSFWQIIVQPGLVWSEPEDDGWSRASFPFALMNRLEQDSHNGVATFAYKNSEVSDVRFQIVTQTAPYYVPEHFKAWGALHAEYETADAAEYAQARDSYAAELADQLEMKPWSELTTGETAGAVSGFEGDTSAEWVVMHALVKDDVVYYQPSQTSEGPYPYTTRMRFGVWSVTKSAGPGVGMLRLAEKYGDWVYTLKLTDYLDINPPHDGWEGVTFGDAVNMATGLGGEEFRANPNDFFVDYNFGGTYDDWYRARSEADKVEMLNKVRIPG